jgi:hypothetical protein
MKSGPEPEPSAASKPELPGEFVSEDMRVDCARFLDDVRTRTALRRESPLGGTWLPMRAVQRDSRRNPGSGRAC